jgi:alpha-beta hydrolase superfamily lysophospholipase
MVGAALFNRSVANRAERQNPPSGRFITVKNARIHYVEKGSGIPLVLLHGNGSMIEDFRSSGLIDLAAKKYRVIAIDRPGFGHSDRPRNTVWTPEAQAELVAVVLRKLKLFMGNIGRARPGHKTLRNGPRVSSRFRILLPQCAS